MNYEIYQAKQPTFMVKKDKVEYNADDYNKVYASTVDAQEGTDGEILEKLFYIFNMTRPHDFHGHSMSVGDIVVLGEQAYICGMIGWLKIKMVQPEGN